MSSKHIMNATVISRFQYLSPFLASDSLNTQKRVHSIKHKAATFVIGSYCFHQTIQSIMNRISWKIPAKPISQARAKFMYMIINTGSPPQLYDLIRFPCTCVTTNTCLKITAKTKRLERTAMSSGIINFNRLPVDLRQLPPARLKVKLRNQTLMSSVHLYWLLTRRCTTGPHFGGVAIYNYKFTHFNTFTRRKLTKFW